MEEYYENTRDYLLFDANDLPIEGHFGDKDTIYGFVSIRAANVDYDAGVGEILVAGYAESKEEEMCEDCWRHLWGHVIEPYASGEVLQFSVLTPHLTIIKEVPQGIDTRPLTEELIDEIVSDECASDCCVQ